MKPISAMFAAAIVIASLALPVSASANTLLETVGDTLTILSESAACKPDNPCDDAPGQVRKRACDPSMEVCN